MRALGTRTCGGCRHWSEMLAQSIGGASVEALCLAENGPCSGKYMVATQTCPAFALNVCGAVDDPPNYGEEPRRCYQILASAKHTSGTPLFSPDGFALDAEGKTLPFEETTAIVAGILFPGITDLVVVNLK